MSEFFVKKIDAVMYTGHSVEQVVCTECKVVITKPRNVKHHRLVFACLTYTVIHMTPKEGITKAENLLLVFKDMEGMYNQIATRQGYIRDYHSINFASMDETKFKPIAEKIKDFCCLVLHDRPVEVTNKLLEIMVGHA